MVAAIEVISDIGCAVPDTNSWSLGAKLKRSTKGLFSSSFPTKQQHDDFAPPAPWTSNPDHEQALRQLQARLSEHPNGCPDEEVLKWFLRDRQFNAVEAEARLKAMLAWRASNRLFDLSADDVQVEYKTGKAYLHQHLDIYGRPAVVVRSCKHRIGEFPINDSKRLCTYMLDTALQQLPAGSDQLLWVVDLQGISMSNIDLMFVAFVLDTVPEHYPRRVGQVLFVDAPWLFKGPWEAFKPMLRKYANLVRFVSRKQLKEEYFTPETVPADFKKP